MRVTDEEFRNLVEQHQAMVFSIAVRITGNRETAEEVSQDVFLKLYSSLRGLESAEHVVFWLRRVAVHRATDALRRRLRHPDCEAEEWREEQHGLPADGPKTGSGFEARLDRILHSLPEPFRNVVILRYQEDLDLNEIATLLGQPQATVKSNLERGLDLMRRKAAVVLKEYVRE